jgi:uncharacterized protein involved in exopolysaccharide biosynthesis
MKLFALTLVATLAFAGAAAATETPAVESEVTVNVESGGEAVIAKEAVIVDAEGAEIEKK